MKSIFIGMLLSVFLTHDAPITIFKIYKVQEQLQLKVNFDTADLSKTLALAPSDLTINTLQTYLEDHIHFRFDAKSYDINVNSVSLKNGHTIVHALFLATPKNYGCITIENTCLLSIANQSNIVRLETGATIRDFRMHKGRTTIAIEN